MNKRTPSVEWTIAESDAEWERLQGSPPSEGEADAHRQRRLKQYLWSVAVLLLLMVGGSDWWWHTAQVRAHQAAAGATATAQQQLAVVAHADDLSAISNPGDQGASSWLPQNGVR